jgi:chromosome segregation ATPase
MKVALYPQYEQIETTWKQYTSFLEGLTWKERRELNKSAWAEVLSGDVFHTQTDIDKLNQLQHTTDDRVQKLNDNYKIWKMKPRRERKIVGCELQLSKLKAERTEREIKSDLEAVDNLQKQIEELKLTIQEKNDKADRLDKRLFFRRLAGKKAARLRNEAANSEEKIAELMRESGKLQDQLQEKNNLRNALEDSIKVLSKKLE